MIIQLKGDFTDIADQLFKEVQECAADGDEAQPDQFRLSASRLQVAGSSPESIEALREIFAQYGCTAILVTTRSTNERKLLVNRPPSQSPAPAND